MDNLSYQGPGPGRIPLAGVVPHGLCMHCIIMTFAVNYNLSYFNYLLFAFFIAVRLLKIT